MNEHSLAERVSDLEQKIGAQKKKDGWDKFQIIAALLIPAAIAFAGFQFSRANSSAQIESASRLAEVSSSIQLMDARVKQATLVSTFMDPLLSTDPSRKRLAIQAVLIALPDDGPRLVSEISESDPNPAVQSFAASQLSDRRGQLIAGLFANEASVRRGAASDLVRGWRRDSAVVPLLVDHAEQNPDNANGIYNTVVVLNELEIESLLEHRELVVDFLRRAEANGARTAERSRFLQRRLQDPS